MVVLIAQKTKPTIYFQMIKDSLRRVALIRLRKRSGLTQKQLAAILDITQPTISAWENYRGYPELPLYKYLHLMHLFNCSFQELAAAIDGEDFIQQLLDDWSTPP